MNKKLKIGLVILSIILIIVLIVVLTRGKDYFHSIIEDNVVFLVDDVTKHYNYKMLPESKTGTKYTLSFWLYINNLPENSNWNTNYKFEKGIISHFGAPNVYYIPKDNIVRVKVGYKDSNYKKEYYNNDIRACKYQKWENIVITVDDRYVAVYLNGTNIGGTYLPSIPWISDRMMYIGQADNNFNGYIGLVEYFNIALKSKDINKNYMKNRSNKMFKKHLQTYSDYYYKKHYKKNN